MRDENGHEIYKDRDGYAGVGDNKVVHREVGLPKGKSPAGEVREAFQTKKWGNFEIAWLDFFQLVTFFEMGYPPPPLKSTWDFFNFGFF